MKNLFSLIMIAVTIASCSKDVSSQSSSSSSNNNGSSSSSGTVLYISGNMHIESSTNKWPTSTEALIAFFTKATQIGKVGNQTTGMKWSVGADIGWLQNEPKAKQTLTTLESLGVNLDIHAHNVSDRAKIYDLLVSWGLHPTKVANGLTYDEIAGMRSPLTYNTTSWQCETVWGIVETPGHSTGSGDDASAGIWKPSDGASYKTNNNNGNLVCIGGYTRKPTDAETLANTLLTQTNQPPVISASVAVEPNTLTVVNSTEDITALETWANRVGKINTVKWATITEIASAWKTAGSINSRRD